MYVLPFHEFMAMEEAASQNLRPRPCACRIEMCYVGYKSNMSRIRAAAPPQTVVSIALTEHELQCLC